MTVAAFVMALIVPPVAVILAGWWVVRRQEAELAAAGGLVPTEGRKTRRKASKDTRKLRLLLRWSGLAMASASVPASFAEPLVGLVAASFGVALLFIAEVLGLRERKEAAVAQAFIAEVFGFPRGRRGPRREAGETAGDTARADRREDA